MPGGQLPPLPTRYLYGPVLFAILPLPLIVVGVVSIAKLRDEVSSEAGCPLTPAEREETDDDKKSCIVCFTGGVL